MQQVSVNVVFPALLTAGIIGMFSGFFGNLLVPAHDEHVSVYIVNPELMDGAAPAAEEPSGPEPIAPLLADASVSDGERVFARQCASCHSIEEGGRHGTGPNLWNVVMLDKAHHDDFGYSSALAEMEGVWTYANLNEFLYKPAGYVRGTRMTFRGLNRVEDRANVVAYLRTFAPEPAPLPEVTAEAEPTDPAGGDGDEPAQE